MGEIDDEYDGQLLDIGSEDNPLPMMTDDEYNDLKARIYETELSPQEESPPAFSISALLAETAKLPFNFAAALMNFVVSNVQKALASALGNNLGSASMQSKLENLAYDADKNVIQPMKNMLSAMPDTLKTGFSMLQNMVRSPEPKPREVEEAKTSENKLSQ